MSGQRLALVGGLLVLIMILGVIDERHVKTAAVHAVFVQGGIDLLPQIRVGQMRVRVRVI